MPGGAEYFARIVSLDEIWREVPGAPEPGRRRVLGCESATPGFCSVRRTCGAGHPAFVAGYPADFSWPEHRLIVEVDGFQYHGHRWAFERDRNRDAAHGLAGYRVIRITWRQLDGEPLTVVATIAAALSASREAH